MFLQIFCGILLPLLGTTLGAAAVFVLRKTPGTTVARVLLGFAAGVMLAASVWSLLLPAIDMASESQTPPWIPSSLGFLLGVGFLFGLDALIPLLRGHKGEDAFRRKTGMLIFAVTLHNIPEGMAVGVVFAGALAGDAVEMAGAFALAFGIAVQNIPEGAIISMPLLPEGVPKGKAFRKGFLSGAVEPVGAVLTLLLASTLTPILPYVLSFAAGAMIYVTVEELIPEAQSGDRVGKSASAGTLSIAAGFVLMMLLDVALG